MRPVWSSWAGERAYTGESQWPRDCAKHFCCIEAEEHHSSLCFTVSGQLGLKPRAAPASYLVSG